MKGRNSTNDTGLLSLFLIFQLTVKVVPSFGWCGNRELEGVLDHAQSEDRARSNEMGELELRATCLEYLMARGGL